MNIFYYRHPKPISSSNICYGQTDLDISRKELEVAVKNLSSFIYPKLNVYSSSLKRCSKIARKLNMNIEYSELLQEISFGIYDGLPWSQIPASELDLWAQDISHFKFKNGESYLDLKSRVSSFFNNLNCRDKDILLITHAGIIRCCLDLFQDISIEESLKYDIPYGEIFQKN